VADVTLPEGLMPRGEHVAPSDGSIRRVEHRGPSSSRFLRCPRPNPSARSRLVCIPFAGGSASVFHHWPAELPSTIEMFGVELAGRGTRFREPALTSVAEVVAPLADELSTDDRPLALFGHSLGALIAFELARALRRRGAREPSLLVASGRRAPHIPKRRAPTHALPDDELVAYLKELNGTPAAVLADPELLALMLPAVRADLAADETYRCAPEPGLDVHVHAFGGETDPTFPLQDLEAWATHTQRGFDFTVFPGDHFFVLQDPLVVIKRLSGLVLQHSY
jgi:medium-chain acyl-[acyl-carrier-protein] hydrolase